MSLHVSSKGITLAGSVHRSKTVMDLYSSVHVKRCVVSCSCLLQRGQSGVVWFKASTLCRYDVRKCDLFVLRCARVRHCALFSVPSIVFIVGAAMCSNVLFFLLLK